MSNKYLAKVARGQLVSYIWQSGEDGVDLTFGVVIHPSPKMPTVLFENQPKPVRIRISNLFNTSSVDWHYIKRNFNKSVLSRYGIDKATPVAPTGGPS